MKNSGFVFLPEIFVSNMGHEKGILGLRKHFILGVKVGRIFNLFNTATVIWEFQGIEVGVITSWL